MGLSRTTTKAVQGSDALVGEILWVFKVQLIPQLCTQFWKLAHLENQPNGVMQEPQPDGYVWPTLCSPNHVNYDTKRGLHCLTQSGNSWIKSAGSSMPDLESVPPKCVRDPQEGQESDMLDNASLSAQAKSPSQLQHFPRVAFGGTAPGKVCCKDENMCKTLTKILASKSQMYFKSAALNGKGGKI